MLTLDALALTLTLISVSLLSGSVLGWLHCRYPAIPGIRDWAVSSALPGLGMLLTLDREVIPVIPAYYLTESSILFAAVFMLRGVQRFTGHPPFRLLNAALVIATMAGLIVFQKNAGSFLANIPATVAWQIISIPVIIALCRNAPNGLSARRVLAVIYGSNAFFQAIVTANALGVSPFADILGSEAWASLYFPLSIAIYLSETVLLLAMVAERLGEDAKQQARDLKIAVERERIILQEQRNFLAMLSHEFRTPLSAISASADFMRLSLDVTSPETDEELDRIKRSVDRMKLLVESCFADEWLSETANAPRNEPIDLKALLTRLVTDRHVALTIHGAKPVTVTGDPTLLPIAISNLVDNALKFSHNRNAVQVQCVALSPTEVCISVADDGPGVSPDEVSRIFEKYYRAPDKLQVPGTGLGLFIVRHIVNMHGGWIEVASPRKGGAVFRIFLPIAAGAGT